MTTPISAPVGDDLAACAEGYDCPNGPHGVCCCNLSQEYLIDQLRRKDARIAELEATAALCRRELDAAGVRIAALTEALERDATWWLLFILSKSGGSAQANGNRWDWINAFCDDEDTDTFNAAVDAGLIRVSHDSDSGVSIAHLTDIGRAALNPKEAP